MGKKSSGHPVSEFIEPDQGTPTPPTQKKWAGVQPKNTHAAQVESDDPRNFHDGPTF